MLLATLAFTAMNAFVKLGTAAFTPYELVFWRSAIGAALVLPLAWRRGKLALASPWMMIGRTLFGVTAMTLGFAALRGLSLAEASLLFQLQPVLVALIAPLVFGAQERVGPGIWGAMGLGFTGAAFILAPGALSGSVWGLLALASAVFSAGAHLFLRPLGKEEDDRAIVFWFLAGSAVVSGAVAPLAQGHAVPVAPSASWLVLLGLAASATVGQLFLTRAYQRERAAVVAATAYAGPLLAAAVDALVFGVLPGWHAWVGGALVVAAGLGLLTGGLPDPRRLLARVSTVAR